MRPWLTVYREFVIQDTGSPLLSILTGLIFEFLYRLREESELDYEFSMIPSGPSLIIFIKFARVL